MVGFERTELSGWARSMGCRQAALRGKVWGRASAVAGGLLGFGQAELRGRACGDAEAELRIPEVKAG